VTAQIENCAGAEVRPRLWRSAGTPAPPAQSGVSGRTPFWRQHNVSPFSIGVELEDFVARRFTSHQADHVDVCQTG
jgi:hypothetical protein